LSAIALEHLAREKECGSWTLRDVKTDIGKDMVDLLDACVAHRKLGIDHRIDEHWAAGIT